MKISIYLLKLEPSTYSDINKSLALDADDDDGTTENASPEQIAVDSSAIDGVGSTVTTTSNVAP